MKVNLTLSCMMTFDLDAGVSLCALLRAAKALSPVAMAAVLQPSNNNTLQVPGETRTFPTLTLKQEVQIGVWS